MIDKITSAFDNIRAEETLKLNTLAYLQSKMYSAEQKNHQNRPIKFARLASALACTIAVAITGILSYWSFFTEVAFVDVDINPSIELAVNRFGRVIGAFPYNDDGEALLAQLNMEYKPCEDAIDMLTEAAIQNGFLIDGGLVSVTVQSENADKENKLLESLKTNISSTIQDHHASARIDVFSVDSVTRTNAHDLCLSPAKYLAIQKLQEVDPTATIEGCRGHSIGKIRSLAKQHGADHHSNPDSRKTAQSIPETETKGHHGARYGNGNYGRSERHHK